MTAISAVVIPNRSTAPDSTSGMSCAGLAAERRKVTVAGSPAAPRMRSVESTAAIVPKWTDSTTSPRQTSMSGA